MEKKKGGGIQPCKYHFSKSRREITKNRIVGQKASNEDGKSGNLCRKGTMCVPNNAARYASVVWNSQKRDQSCCPSSNKSHFHTILPSFFSASFEHANLFPAKNDYHNEAKLFKFQSYNIVLDWFQVMWVKFWVMTRDRL